MGRLFAHGTVAYVLGSCLCMAYRLLIEKQGHEMVSIFYGVLCFMGITRYNMLK